MIFYSIANAKIRYGSVSNLLKMIKQRMARVLSCLKCQNKVRLGFCSIENAGIKYLLLGLYSIENAKTRYYWGFNLMKILK